MNLQALFFLFCLFYSVFIAQAQNPFQANIRPTDPLKPEEQQKTFSLPKGFSISLVASEPEIAKPLNLAFDHRGRLWATTSDAYPYKIEGNQFEKYSDSLKIFEDHDGDGTADAIHTFADKLNIPIGFYPYKNGAVVWSIPNILWLEDTDGDNKADLRKVLYGPSGQVIDTHGMHNAFRRGLDGWLYINHGFNNTSQIKGLDGSEIHLHSGNTYRVNLDGKTVQQYTWGQVNPFGSDFDKFGFLYTADCHTLPIYQLMKGAYYPSFGKPHDGLGFAPKVMQHIHGSTAISGLVLVDDPIWPQEYQENIFVGNVMTSRINRDVMRYEGSSPKAKEAIDFVVSSDPWFRPVDLRWGPDGAMYVADFYNKIIGHYEVPLDHPKRDRKRGRIWRITYNGDNESQRWNYPRLNLSKDNIHSAVSELSSHNKTRRLLSLNYLVDQHPNRAIREFNKILSNEFSPSMARPLALWGLERLGQLSDARILNAMVDKQENMRVQAFKICAERPDISQVLSRSLAQGIRDRSPMVQRVAAAALSSHPESKYLRLLLEFKSEIPQKDDHLAHRVKLSLRQIVKTLDNYQLVKELFSNQDYLAHIQELLLAIPSSKSSQFLANNISDLTVDLKDSHTLFLHLVKNLPPNDFVKLISLIPAATDDTHTQSLERMKVLVAETKARGISFNVLPDAIKSRLNQISKFSLENLTSLPLRSFRFLRDYSNPNKNIPWFVQNRSSLDGKNDEKFMSSLPNGGESFTGTLRSNEFKIPGKLSFYLAGHSGYPENKPHEKNYIQLVDSKTGRVIKKSFPPRNDLAQPYTWALREESGKTGYIEIHDGDAAGAYAWLAAGRFSDPKLEVDDLGPRQILNRMSQVIEGIKNIDSSSNDELLNNLFQRPDLPSQARLLLANLMAKKQPDQFWSALKERLEGIRRTTPGFFRELMEWASSRTNQEALDMVLDGFPILEFQWQRRCANSLVKHDKGSNLLAKVVEMGVASQFLLKEEHLWEAVAPHFTAQKKADFMEVRNQLSRSKSDSEITIPEIEKNISELPFDLVKGEELFKLHCSICHQFNNVGKLIGPQLDGIANRGRSRILEDILYPSLNLDVAFRLRMIELDTGELLTGLFKHVNGQQKVFIDIQGNEFSVDSADIVDESIIAQSLMPSSFDQILSNQDLSNLLSYLSTN